MLLICVFAYKIASIKSKIIWTSEPMSEPMRALNGRPRSHLLVLSCPVLQPFWAGIRAATKNILGFNIEFTCLSFYFIIMPEDLDIRNKYSFKILIITSNKAITRPWLLQL